VLERLFNPKSICIVGASSNPQKLAGRPLIRLRQNRFDGEIHLVNPSVDEIDGVRCHASISDIPTPVDVAMIMLPAAAVPGAIRQCGEAGIPFAVVCGSGFGEDPAAGPLVSELASAIAESGVRVVGPNCEGIWSLPASMTLTFGSAADRTDLLSGPVSIVSQSGSIGGACMSLLQERRLGCRFFVSSGNEDDLTAMDFLEHLVDEGGSRVIALFLEGLSDGERLRSIASRAAEAGVRLVALVGGVSDAGRAATSSHTGRMASPGDVYEALLPRCGVLGVRTLDELISAIEVGLIGAGPRQVERAVGSGVGVVAVSGGSRALLADACDREGVPLATFTDSTESALDSLLPQFAYSKNPTDLTGQVVANPGLFTEVLQTVANDAGTEAVVIQYANGAERQLDAHLEQVADVAERLRLPIILSLLTPVSESLVHRIRRTGLLITTDPARAVLVLSWLYRWREFEQRARQLPQAPIENRTISTETWADHMAALTQSGIQVAKWHLWDRSEAIADIPLEFPVVLKAPPELAEHKTEAGLVFVGLDNVFALDEAADRYWSQVGESAPALLQEMAPSGVEVLLAVRTDPDFGPVLAIGSGGILTEWLRDVTYLPLPASESEIRRALDDTKVRALLDPFRGRERCDVDALVRAARSLGNLYLELADPAMEIEINPIIVSSAGAVAVDALFVEMS